MSLAASQIEHEQSMESNLRNRIEQIMSRFVGFDKVRSEVDVLLNFTEVETTYEDFDRENLGGLTRSEVLNIDETEVSSGEGGPQAGTFVQHQTKLRQLLNSPSKLAVPLPGIMSLIGKSAMSNNRLG